MGMYSILCLLYCSFGWYFTFIQGFVYLFLIYLQGFTTKHIVNPMRTYVKLSAVLMGSHGLTKGSLAYLNYPAQIMFKSTKVINPQFPVTISMSLKCLENYQNDGMTDLSGVLGIAGDDHGSVHTRSAKKIPSP